MLIGDFFILNSIEANEDSIRAEIELNPGHRIFEGHFPGQPVVPGVCMMQMIKELLEQAIKGKTRLLKSDYAKFLSMIDPRSDKTVIAELAYTVTGNCEIEVVATLTTQSRVFLKYKAVFVSVE